MNKATEKRIKLLKTTLEEILHLEKENVGLCINIWELQYQVDQLKKEIERGPKYEIT
jgi:hypothetical protein